ncbi:hypothetical protein K438DRAFT_1832583 [Mycena galopus ATCC 62051]|nr:hypothetical protein K438DRAFT_1832583 [Mycena galopus ATCC 62051]
MCGSITGTNDVPLGQRRQFGPAPINVEEAAPPHLAQPSPPASPHPQTDSPGKRGRSDSPPPKGTLLTH